MAVLLIACVCVCVCACVRACVCACVRACVRVCVCVSFQLSFVGQEVVFLFCFFRARVSVCVLQLFFSSLFFALI